MEKEGTLQLSKSHAYFYQIQTQMYVTGFHWCDFFVWSATAEPFLQQINYDATFMDKALLTAKAFNFHKFYPQLLDVLLYSHLVLVILLVIGAIVLVIVATLFVVEVILLVMVATLLVRVATLPMRVATLPIRVATLPMRVATLLVSINHKGQNKSEKWLCERQLCITSSVMKEICHHCASTSCEAFIRKKLSTTPINVPAINYGKSNEHAAITG